MEIRFKYKNGLTQKQLSIEYGICSKNISEIINNKRYIRNIDK
jgi:plasmid maintenance system antidote protein VapI